MDEGKIRKSKSNSLLSILENKFYNGTFLPDTSFFSKEELAKTYQICPMTAHKIIRQLKEKGFLNCSRGRRTRVNILPESKKKKIHLTRPVGFVSQTNRFSDKSEWYDWVIHLTQRELLNDGNSSILLPALNDTTPERLADSCGAIVMMQNDLYDIIPEKMYPFPVITLSYSLPLPDSVFIDYRSALDQILMNMVQKKTKKIYWIGHSKLRLEKIIEWHRELGFMRHAEPYGFTKNSFESICLEHSEKELKNLRKTAGKSSERCAFFLLQTVNPQLLDNEMKKYGKILLRDYDIFMYTKPITEFLDSTSYVDVACETVTKMILEQLYGHVEQNQPQPAKILVPSVRFCS